MDSIQRQILQNHCLYQTSWLGEPKCSHVTLSLRTPRRTSKSSQENIDSLKSNHGSRGEKNTFGSIKYDAKIPTSESPSDAGSPFADVKSKLVKSEILDHSGHAWNTTSPTEGRKHPRRRPTSLPASFGDMRTSFEILEERRNVRVGRRKPWRESHSRISKTHGLSSDSVLFYGAYLPDDKEGGELKRRSRKYVTNSKYGDIYELKNPKVKSPERPPPLGTWFWEDDFHIWKYDKLVSSSRSSESWRSSTDRTTTRSKVYVNGQKSKQTNKPHADLFAHYHSYRLEKQRQRDGAVMIQKHVRGWLIRARIKRLKRKVLLEHGMSWQKFVLEYKQLVVRLQARYGESRRECGIDLDELENFMNLKYQYERAFDDCAYGAKLLKSDLPMFFNKCGLYPEDKEISKAFDTVFKSAGNTAEVVFVLDCSSSVGPYALKHLTTFVKDVIRSFDVGQESTRVAVIPYNEDIFQSFGLSDFKTKQSVMNAIDEIQAQSGITRTDLAIRRMSKMMLEARPGVQRLGVVITDGRSSHPDQTKLAAAAAHRDNITVFAIGVGDGVDKEEMNSIASSPKHVFTVSDYTTLKSLRETLAKSTCLEAQQEGTIQGKCRPLFKNETMEMLWTIYPPPATRINENKKSTWMRPIVNGVEKEVWSVLDDEQLQATDIKTCLRVVIQAKLEREGFICLPSNVRSGIEKVTNTEEAMKMVDDWMKSKKNDGQV